VTLPITQVVMFNSGVGYFARSGKVTDDARVDLSFPETDINDLLKSMTLQDLDSGRVSAVSYDSREPVARTLSSFAINLNNQPTLAGILTQARGEKIEVVMQPGATTQPDNLSGTIVGIENQKIPVGTAQLDTQMLNILMGEGLRCIKMMDIQRVRFTNSVLEAELKRGLDVLALSHDTAKKAVQMHFSGDGERRVKVGYVIESPIWKTSYRLVLDNDGKPYLQGWAIVENTTDEDWNSVKMALISGRPISFKMDLYNPLYVPRPTVEPELFASLRPPAQEGGFKGRDQNASAPEATAQSQLAVELKKSNRRVTEAKELGAGDSLLKTSPPIANGDGGRLFAKELADRMELGSVQLGATASKLGDFFQYAIDHPVNLARQKSALLPIVGKEIEGGRVSIYNPSVQAKYPLLGLKFKNTSGSHLSLGPITVFEGSTYAGDARLLDTPPKDERIIAYAVDLATEVIVQTPNGTSKITSVKSNKGVVHIARRIREEKVYKITNKSDTNRTLLIEQANRTNQQFNLIERPSRWRNWPHSTASRRKPRPGPMLSSQGRRRTRSGRRPGAHELERRHHPLRHQPQREQRRSQCEARRRPQGEGDAGLHDAGPAPSGDRHRADHGRSGPHPQEPPGNPEGSGGLRRLPEEAERAGERNGRADGQAEEADGVGVQGPQGLRGLPR